MKNLHSYCSIQEQLYHRSGRGEQVEIVDPVNSVFA